MVYVGLDVHRKRTQVAIMQEDGTEILNRNVVNDPAELSPLLGTLEPGTPVVFEAAYGLGVAGRAPGRLGSRGAPRSRQELQGDRVGEAQERQGRRAHARTSAARRSAAGGVDRPARGTRSARSSAAPRFPRTLRHRAQKSDPFRSRG